MEFHGPLAEQETCASERCTCPVDPDLGVTKDGKRYCCQSCADGTGCSNPICTGKP